MGLLNIIRRMALREKLPLREIARRTGLSRNTIKKYLNADTIALRANKRETFDWLKFTLEGEGERTHGYAFTDTAFARYRV